MFFFITSVIARVSKAQSPVVVVKWSARKRARYALTQPRTSLRVQRDTRRKRVTAVLLNPCRTCRQTVNEESSWLFCSQVWLWVSCDDTRFVCCWWRSAVYCNLLRGRRAGVCLDRLTQTLETISCRLHRGSPLHHHHYQPYCCWCWWGRVGVSAGAVQPHCTSLAVGRPRLDITSHYSSSWLSWKRLASTANPWPSTSHQSILF